jgi:hypothetical protein
VEKDSTVNNYKTLLETVLAHWEAQPDKNDLAINAEYLKNMMAACESESALNPEWITATHEVFMYKPTPQPPMFVKLD